jgi:AcrR family transcriptional regulator
MAGPAYTRLDVDERRRRLLELGTDLFARFSYDELSMARIAREAGISKALLYHYFPSKQAYFSATLEDKAGELMAVMAQADPSLPPFEQLSAGLDAFLGWVEENRAAYGRLVRSAAAIPEVREVVDQVRDVTAARILAGLDPHDDARAALRTAVRAWLWFMDGAILDWSEYGDVSRDELRGLLLGTLLGAIGAAGEGGRLPTSPTAGR